MGRGSSSIRLIQFNSTVDWGLVTLYRLHGTVFYDAGQRDPDSPWAAIHYWFQAGWGWWRCLGDVSVFREIWAVLLLIPWGGAGELESHVILKTLKLEGVVLILDEWSKLMMMLLLELLGYHIIAGVKCVTVCRLKCFGNDFWILVNGFFCIFWSCLLKILCYHLRDMSFLYLVLWIHCAVIYYSKCPTKDCYEYEHKYMCQLCVCENYELICYLRSEMIYLGFLFGSSHAPKYPVMHLHIQSCTFT